MVSTIVYLYKVEVSGRVLQDYSKIILIKATYANWIVSVPSGAIQRNVILDLLFLFV